MFALLATHRTYMLYSASFNYESDIMKSGVDARF